MKKLCLIVLSVILTASLLCACGSGSIVGKWVFGGSTYEFKEDKTVSISINGALNFDGTYETNGDKVVVTVTDLLGSEKKVEFTYAVKGDKLTLTGDVTMTGTSATLEFSKVK